MDSLGKLDGLFVGATDGFFVGDTDGDNVGFGAVTYQQIMELYHEICGRGEGQNGLVQ